MALICDCGSEMRGSAGRRLSIDIGKGRGPSQVVKLAKTTWTFAVEGIVEYARVVFDLYGGKMKLPVISAGLESRTVLASDEPQHLSKLLGRLCELSQGLQSGVYPSVQDHFVSAVQLAIRQLDVTVLGKKHIILLTTFNPDKSSIISEAVEAAALRGGSQTVPFSVLILNLCSSESQAQSHASQSPMSMTCDVRSVWCSSLVEHMSNLVKQHYNLHCSVITGIPMKEEQQAGMSANYDVNILHPANVFMEAGSKDKNLELRWLMPHSNSLELHQCPGAVRITPADVTSRPASCLVNFLLQGRAVTLEPLNRSKTLSYVLANHEGTYGGLKFREHTVQSAEKLISILLTLHLFANLLGVIYLHCYTSNSGRSFLEDPPSISEGCGGRVTDYRINDFGELMRSSQLAPQPHDSSEINSTQLAMRRLEMLTHYWPLVISETILFNIPDECEPLLSLMKSPEMTDDEVTACKQKLVRLQDKELNSEPLPLPGLNIRSRGPRREELYRQLWTELQQYIEGFSRLSSNHEKVYRFLKDLKVGDIESQPMPSSSEVSWIPSSDWPHDSHRNQVDNGGIHPAKKPRFSQQGLSKLQCNKANYFHIISGSSKSLSLLEVCKKHGKLTSLSRTEFDRREREGDVVKLYPKLDVDDSKTQKQ